MILRSALAALLLAGMAVAQPVSSQAIGTSTSEPQPGTSRSNHLRGGWYPWDPYQYLDCSWGQFLTGFDVEIQRAVERIMGVELALPQRDWEDHLAALAGRHLRFLVASECIVRRWPTEFHPTVSDSTALLDSLFHPRRNLGVERA